MHGLVDLRDIEFNVQLLDIQQLNERLLAGGLDVAKASFSAAIELAERYWVLPSGSALGFGVGPLLLAAKPRTFPEHVEQLTLCPGKHTTAALLFDLFHANTTRVEHTVFSEIMPRLQAGSADFGVCIHEGRFTWQAAGLQLVEDLGTRWETETRSPLPLGGILASKQLDQQLALDVQAVLFDSLQFARAHPERALPTMRQYAQEFDDEVLMQHVELYVNEWTFDLGDVGRRALAELSGRAQAIRSRSFVGSLEVLASG
jgi:1,4-dihydroxy-6-naphthoate synthase